MVKLDVKDSENKTLGLNSFYFKLQYVPHAYTVMTMNRKLLVNHAVHILILIYVFLILVILI